MRVQVEVHSEGYFEGPSAVQVELEGQFGEPSGVQVALGGQFERPSGVQIALGGHSDSVLVRLGGHLQAVRSPTWPSWSKTGSAPPDRSEAPGEDL